MCQNQNTAVRPEKSHSSWKATMMIAVHCAIFLLSIPLRFQSRGVEVFAATSLSLLLACASPQAPSVGRGDAEAVLWTRFKAETQIGAFPAVLCQSHWLNKEPWETSCLIQVVSSVGQVLSSVFPAICLSRLQSGDLFSTPLLKSS